MRFAPPPIRTRLSSVRGHVEGESRHAAVAARATYTRPRNRSAPEDRGKTPRARDDLRGGDGSLDSACTSGGLGSGEMQRREREICAALAPGAERRRRELVAAPSSVANGPPLAHACSRSRAARQKEEWRELRPYAPSASLVPERLAVARAGEAVENRKTAPPQVNWAATASRDI